MKRKTIRKATFNLVLYTLVLTLLTGLGYAQDCSSQNDAIAGYTYDDGENLVDVSGNNHNLTNDGTENISGKIGEARHYVVGNTDLLQIGNPEFIANYDNYSLICWFNSTNDNAGAVYSEANSGNDNDFLRIFIESSGDGGDVYFQHLSASGTDIAVQGGANVNDGTYHHLVVTRAGSLFNIFIDGELDVTGSADVGDLASNRAAFGVLWRQTPFVYFDGNIDDCYIYNRTITNTEINDSYNNDIGCQPYAIIVISPQIDLLFANDTATTTYKTVFDEGEEISGYVNWTLSNGTIIDNSSGSCNMTFIAGILEDRSNNTNFTICNTGCDFDSFTEQFSFHSANLTDPVVEDSVRFDACHLSSPVRDIDVSIQCGGSSNNFTVDKSEFPLCSTGTGTIVVNFTECINSLAINVTVDNPAVNIGQGHRILNFEVDREYVAHLNNGTDVFFNSSIDLWQTSHTHEYYREGSKEIYANCTHTINSNFSVNASENITIINVPPQIFIERVTTSLGVTTLSEGVVIEFANGTWTWFIAVVDDDIDFINYSWFNSSGIMIFNVTANGTPETVNTSSDLFVDFDGNPFNLTVFANDTFGNSTTLFITFNVTDSLDPSCDFASRYFIEMGNFTFNVTCSDENFFSLNVTCPINNQSFNITGLNVEEYVFNQTFFLNVTDTCTFWYCDGHTAEFLESVWFTSKKGYKEEIYRDFTKISELWVEDGEIEFKQLHDRINFKIKFDDTKKPYQTVFYNVSEKSSHLFSDKYPGWIADPVSSTWFDLNNIVKAPVMTIDRGNGLWEFRIYTNEKEVEFQSIGELNCISGSFDIVAAFDYTLEPGVCPTTVAEVLTMWMVLGLALFLMSVGWIWKIREPGFFGSLLLITFSWTVVACHLWAGYICAGIGAYFLFWFILKK